MKYLTCLLLAAAAVLHAAEPVDLETGFHHPPVTARPHTYWMWMNGNVTRDGITADLV